MTRLNKKALSKTLEDLGEDHNGDAFDSRLVSVIIQTYLDNAAHQGETRPTESEIDDIIKEFYISPFSTWSKVAAQQIHSLIVGDKDEL